MRRPSAPSDGIDERQPRGVGHSGSSPRRSVPKRRSINSPSAREESHFVAWAMPEGKGDRRLAAAPAARYVPHLTEGPIVFGHRAATTLLGMSLALSLVVHPVPSNAQVVNGAWSSLATLNPPSPRKGHTAIYDPVADRMIVFGGEGLNGQGQEVLFNETWALDFCTLQWTLLPTQGTPPCGRADHAAVYDNANYAM